MADELLPCPLCGGGAAFNKTTTTDPDFIRLNNRDTGHGVNCIACGATTRGFAIGYKDKESASAAWNRRPPAVPVAELEALQRYDVTCRLCRGDAEQEVEPDRQGCWYKAEDLAALVGKYRAGGE